MNDVEPFQIFLVLVLEDVVNFSHPRHRRVILSLGQCMEVQDDVVALD